ncbi:MAG: dTMP kinase [Gemmatimonadales bacterium]|nr:MAG: dTMP kinase [Gemmatimonadales bacterium]
MNPSEGSGASSPRGEGRRGLFLVIEGVEGAGKSTQVERLAHWIDALGIEAVRAREPGGTAVGEAVREILLDREELRIGAESELFLMLAARAAFMREFVRPTLQRGAVMIADRFEFSTFAYQGFGRGLPLEEVRRLNAFATGGLRPDLVLILDLPAAEGRARQRTAGKVDDRIEASGDGFLERVASGYRVLAEEDDRAVLVDALLEPDGVESRIRSELALRFPEPFGTAGGSTTSKQPEPPPLSE